MIEIRPIKKTDSVKAFRDFICELIDENAYLLIDKKPTLREEKIWFKEKLNSIRNNKEVCLTIWNNKKLVAICDAKKGRWKEKENILLGIAILKSYRGKGLGEKLLRDITLIAKKKLNPKNIYLGVFADNTIARNLYRKLGFKQFAVFPKWGKHNGKYLDHIYMILKK